MKPEPRAGLASGVYLIWDEQAAEGVDPEVFLSACGERLPVAVQLRAKGRSPTEPPEALISALRSACACRGIPFIINDHSAWLRPGVSGLHLGQDDGVAPSGSGLRIGRSTHNPEQLRVAAADPSVDWLAFGPLFITQSKPDAEAARGVSSLPSLCALAGEKPLITIGGVRGEHLPRLRSSGVHAVAVIGAVFGADDPVRALCELVAAWERA